MKLVGVTRTATPNPLVDEVRPLSALHDALRGADAIVVALALTEQTHHLIGREAFAVCKPSALLVNVARGGLVDPAALRDALTSGRIAGAGLDVTEPEPLPADDPLWDCPNLIISGHFAGGGSLRAQERLAAGAADNLARLVAGQPLLNEASA
jgi:phosphoglycerate dehydrogenase-like enzyme